MKDSSARLNELICTDCGQYESECKCDKLFHNHPVFSPPPVIGDLGEKIAEVIKSTWADGGIGAETSATSILSIVKEAGYVKLDKDQIQLSDTDEVIIDKVGLDPFVVRGMVKAGWRKIA